MLNSNRLWVAAVTAMAAVSAAETPAVALPFRAPISQLVGTIALPKIQVPFDFGQEFSHVESVALELLVSVTPFEFDRCGSVFEPQPCVHEISRGGILVGLDDDPYPGLIFTAVGDGTITELPSLQVGRFESRFATFNFDTFRDGKGLLDVYWNAPVVLPEDLILNVVSPTGTIFEAYIVFDAVPIPEPSTALLLASGLGVLAQRKWQKIGGSGSNLRQGGSGHVSSARSLRRRARGSTHPHRSEFGASNRDDL